MVNELKSGDISLRALQESDALRLAELANNEKIGVNLRDGFPFPYTIDDARSFINQFMHSGTIFAIEYRGEYVGNIGLTPCNNVYRKSAEIGYFIGEPYWNKGIATLAVKIISDFGFRELGLARIHTGVYEYNPASQRVLEKCGFIREGIFRKAIFKKGKLWNEIRFALLNNEM
jgi:[ribosomal protein S5]-alanine N-acetyltransferase